MAGNNSVSGLLLDGYVSSFPLCRYLVKHVFRTNKLVVMGW